MQLSKLRHRRRSETAATGRVRDRRYRKALMCPLSIIQERQADRKRAADLRRAVHLDRAVVIFQNLLCDVETKAGAALALLGREIRIEDFRHLRRRDSVAGILDADVDVKIFALATDGDLALFIRRRLERVDDYILNRDRK